MNRLSFIPTIVVVRCCAVAACVVAAMFVVGRATAEEGSAELESRFPKTVHSFLQTYCVECHGGKEPEADLNLAAIVSPVEARKESGRWSTIIEKLSASEMPPKKAKQQPTADERKAAIEWLRAARELEIAQNAGDPGVVPVRRLSNAEYDATIRDLTGVDIRPAREFPVDPANTAGFDNSAESLTMSPSLVKKYLQAARDVASHMALQPDGFLFAPHPVVTDDDRDKVCVQRIIAFYHAQVTDYAEYFAAAWAYKHREALGQPDANLAKFAADRKLSAKYLGTIWHVLEEEKPEVGPLVKLQALWRDLPAPDGKKPDVARPACEAMRDYVVQLRKKVEPRFLNITAGKVNTSAEPLLIWKNVQYATHRMTFDPAQLQVEGEDKPAASTAEEPGAKDEFGPGHTQLIKNADGDPDLVVPKGQRAKYEAAFAQFCRVFPDRFTMEERGRNYFDTTKDRGRYLNAGFHSLLGYFRDDQPLYELLLDEQQQKQLDRLWDDLDFIADASRRTYIQFATSWERFDRNFKSADKTDALNNKDVASADHIKRFHDDYLARAKGGDARGIEAINLYFNSYNDAIRRTEQARQQAEPKQVDALVAFAARAYRRPLTPEEQADVRGYYNACRKDGLTHEEAIREGIVAVLVAPEFCFRLDLARRGEGIQPLSDHDLANRLSYFLWSSMPDDELMAHAAAGNLHEPAELLKQARRMLKDEKIRGLAVDFGGAWLDFRRFDEIATVDRERFPAFTPELREAMYEEPIHFLVHAFQENRSLLDLLYGKHTFVNGVLAKHYGIPMPAGADTKWRRIDDSTPYGRGGLLPMAAFLTKNSPGLRTSPVKRGNWVVRNLLGERISPPPPNVPQLPKDEAKLDLPLREVLARHRQDAACAACHARFDSLGLVLEGFGPIGERRSTDLAGHAVDTSASFPDGAGDYKDLAGLRDYIHQKRENDFVDNACRKLLAYALGRSLILSDEPLVKQMREKLAENDHRFATMIEQIVTSRQFLNKRS